MLGFVIVVPVIVFGLLHMRNTFNRPNRRAVLVGYALFLTSIVLLVSGVVLTRLEGSRCATRSCAASRIGRT